MPLRLRFAKTFDCKSLDVYTPSRTKSIQVPGVQNERGVSSESTKLILSTKHTCFSENQRILVQELYALKQERMQNGK